MVTTPEPITMQRDREQILAMTYEEWQALVAENAHSEWVNGEVTIFMSPKDKHQALLDLLHLLIGNFVYCFGLGIVRFAPYEMRAIPGGPVREPDLLFVAREHLDRVTANGLTGPADLIVEIISPESVRRDRADKFYEYEEAGVPEYWLLDPRAGKERSEFYQLNERGQYMPVLPDAAGRYHSAVLPGFWLDPAWLWQEPLPNPLALLAQIAPDAFPFTRLATSD